MKYLLDTHTLLWIVTDDPQLSKRAVNYFLSERNDIYFSIAGLWEMAIKIILKKLILKQSLNEFFNEHIIGNNIRLLDIKTEHVLKLENLKFHHRDPFDRLVVCQCLVEKMAIISNDKIFSKYLVKRVW